MVHGSSRVRRSSDNTCDHWWELDLADLAAVHRVLEATRADVVVHLASEVSGARAMDGVLRLLHANLVSALNVLIACAECRSPRVVLTGSIEEPHPMPEWPIPCSPYAAAKFAASSYARFFHACYGTPVVCLRLTMVYGPGQRDTRKLVPYVATSLLQGESPALSSGARRADWVYIDDVANAFLLAAITPGLEGRTLDVGTGKLTSVREIVERLVRICDVNVSPIFGAIPERSNEQEQFADVEVSEACMAWRAQTGLDDGLARTVNFYRRQMPVVSKPDSRAME
jgi:nucleoside-diphosphate-sugar epimerase